MKRHPLMNSMRHRSTFVTTSTHVSSLTSRWTVYMLLLTWMPVVVSMVLLGVGQGVAAGGNQRDSLMDLFNAMNGPSWYNNSGWGTSSDYCTWYGVGCPDDKDNVENIELEGNNLSGTMIPESIGGLPFLLGFNLHNNSIRAAVPAFVANHSTLKNIYLADNFMYGSLPPLVGPNVLYITLGSNQFTGTLPKTWGFSPGLIYIDVAHNRLTGSLPDEWATLVNLDQLFLDGNQLTGSLPPAWKTLTKITSIHAGFNSFYNVTNMLSGTLPASWSTLDRLVTLGLAGMQLTGSLPSSWSNMSSLAIVQLQNNLLTGTLPPSWGGNRLSNLTQVEIFGNRLNGTLPPEWGLMSAMQLLSLQGNAISGTLPTSWSSMSSLLSLGLSSNQLHGTLPPEWGTLHLMMLDLQDNAQLSGKIPSS